MLPASLQGLRAAIIGANIVMAIIGANIVMAIIGANIVMAKPAASAEVSNKMPRLVAG